MVDVLAQLDRPLAIGSDTPAPVRLRHGGAAANTAVWLASFGAPAAFLGRVGGDAFGSEFRDALAERGVLDAVTVDPGQPTGVCIVLVDGTGERTMIPSPGANSMLSVDAVPAELISTASRLHVSGYALLHGAREAAVHAISLAAAAGVPVSIDVASAAPIRAAGVELFLDGIPEDVLLIANEAEAEVLTGIGEPAHAAGELAGRYRTVVVKCGPAGAVAVAQHGEVQVIPAEPATVLDSTGAGDAFAAGVLAGLSGDASLFDAVSMGNRAGARAIAQIGAWPELSALRPHPFPEVPS